MSISQCKYPWVRQSQPWWNANPNRFYLLQVQVFLSKVEYQLFEEMMDFIPKILSLKVRNSLQKSLSTLCSLASIQRKSGTGSTNSRHSPMQLNLTKFINWFTNAFFNSAKKAKTQFLLLKTSMTCISNPKINNMSITRSMGQWTKWDAAICIWKNMIEDWDHRPAKSVVTDYGLI